MSLLQWWYQREEWERYLLAGGIVFIFILALYLVLEPYIYERGRMLDEIPRLNADLVWMQTHAADIQALMGKKGIEIENVSNTLSLASVQAILNNFALQEVVNELSPMDNQSIRVKFNEISYPLLVDLMYQLTDRTGAHIKNAEFLQIEDKLGFVQASLILGQ